MMLHRNSPSKPILVLGSGGFIGRHLVSTLQSSGVVPFEVRGRSDCDLRNYQSVLGRLQHVSPETVIHLAASPDAKSEICSSVKGLINTVLCTLNVVLVTKKVPPSLVIHVGSYKQYGDAPLPFKETESPRPRTLHGIAKHISEMMLRARQSDSVKVVCIRMGPVFGPGQDYEYLVARSIQTILSRSSDTLIASEVPWDPIYITDAINAITLCMSRTQVQGHIVNVSGGTSYSPYQIMCLIAEAMDARSVSIIKQKNMAGAWACLGDVELAHRLLEWRPTVPIPLAIRHTVDYYHAHKRRTQH